MDLTPWDIYDSAVVAAKTEAEAKKMNPNGQEYIHSGAWTSPENVSVRLLGIASPGTKKGVICASFNAG